MTKGRDRLAIAAAAVALLAGCSGWAIIRRADRNRRLASQRASRPNRRPADRTDGVDRIHQPQEREVLADTR
jgi:hypothetical protein